MTTTEISTGTKTRTPAVLGGNPAFEKTVSIIRPNLPPWSSVSKRLEDIYSSRMITNHKTVEELETKMARFVGSRHVVALSSCSSGLILTLKALGITGEVIVPSFTFSATGHAIYWAGARPVFADCSERDWNISIESIRKAVSKDTEAILAVHIFGNPAPVHALEEIAEQLGIPLIFDAAHAFGASVGNRRIGGFGTAEIFSLSPTKLLTGGEGGLLVTDSDELAAKVRMLRNYGDPGTYDCFAPGLNARMAEFNAALVLEGLPLVDPEITSRQNLAGIYYGELSRLPGIRFQEISDGSQHTYKDFTIVVDENGFGIDRDALHRCLLAENIQTKKYFYPPLHMQSAYMNLPHRSVDLTVTEWLTHNVLTLPLYSALGKKGVAGIASAIASIHAHTREIGLTRRQLQG